MSFGVHLRFQRFSLSASSIDDRAVDSASKSQESIMAGVESSSTVRKFDCEDLPSELLKRLQAPLSDE